MENQFIIDFVKNKVQSSTLSFFQYAKRGKLQHLGGAEIAPQAFDEYMPDNIKGFTTMEMAMSLEPIKMAIELSPGIKLTYELDTCAELDWIRNGRLIQVGLSYKGVNFKLYECAWGYAPNTNYEAKNDIKTFQKALSMGNIHIGINAYVGVHSMMARVNWAEELNPQDNDFPDLQANGLVKHSREARPSEVIDLFVQDSAKRLHISHIFARVMDFGGSNIKVDITNKDIQEIHFHVDYALGKYFVINPSVERVHVGFQVTQENRDFMTFNRDLLLRAKGLKLDSVLYNNLKNAQLQELAQQYCVISYRNGDISGAVLSNRMAYKLLVERTEEGSGKFGFDVFGVSHKIARKKFLEQLTVQDLTIEQLNFWRDNVGKSVGVVSWYDSSLEGGLFQVREKKSEAEVVS